ncbi:MAG: hypothetical protein D6742_13050 [Cyanobacteria bacterium J069]|nr:MAG: hypothetical protein D6742_13050 [Cyanobacteria bacterium J069]
MDEVIQNLSQDPNLLRIKKLLIYASRQIWERDPVQIQQADLYPLVQDLRTQYPTRQILEGHLTALVNTLSKVTEYTLVANAALSHLEPLYPVNESLSLTASPQAYQQVAAQLEQNPNGIRIKKLLFSACTQTWENDPQVLNQHSLVELVQRLHRLTATPQTLDAILTSIVRTLNRQTEYTRVAQTIISAFAPLYGDGLELTQANLATPVADTADETRIHSPVALSPPSDVVTPALSEAESFPESAVPASAALAAATSESAAPQPLSPDDPAALVDLRLAVMKYANPLRAKLLLFAVLHEPLPPGLPAWTHLKGYDLDALLRQTLQQYPTLTALKADVMRIAERLAALELEGDRPAATHDTSPYHPVASALLRALQPFYPITTPEHPAAPASAEVSEHCQSYLGAPPPAPARPDPTGIVGQLESAPESFQNNASGSEPSCEYL